MNLNDKDLDVQYSDYMRDEWNVLYTELPDGDGLIQFFNSRQDIQGRGRYITSARISELEEFVANAGPKDYFRTKEGVKIARKRLNNVLSWARPRVEQSKQRQHISEPSNLLFAAMHRIAVKREQEGEAPEISTPENDTQWAERISKGGGESLPLFDDVTEPGRPRMR